MGVKGLLGVLGDSAFDLLLFDLRMTNSNRHFDIKQIKPSLSTILDVFWVISLHPHDNMTRSVLFLGPRHGSSHLILMTTPRGCCYSYLHGKLHFILFYFTF